MKKPEKLHMSAGSLICLVTASLMLLGAASLILCFYYLKYVPFVLMAAVIALPALINLFLLIPPGKVYKKLPKATKEKKEKQKISFKEFVKKIIPSVKKAFFKTVDLFSKTRRVFILAFAVASFFGANLLFWLYYNKAGAHSLGFIVPLVLAALFVLFIVLDKWITHSEDALSDTRCGVIAENLRSVLSICRVMLVFAGVIATVCVLGFFDLQKWLIIGLMLIFLYENIFLVMSFAVRIIRRELFENPEITVPMPGSGKEDYGITAYLEKNTGITMRSLWSIKLIKKIIPYAALSTVLVLWLSTGVVQIEPYQQGALYRLGKLESDSLKPGLHITLPAPFDKVEIYDTESVNEVTIGYLSTEATNNLWTEAHGNNEYKLLLGGGKELVSINLRVQYKISNLGDYLRCSVSPESLVESAAYETVTNKTISTDLDSMLETDRSVFSKEFEKELRARISKYNTGLEIKSVIVESIHPPVEIAHIYQRIISAGIEAEKIVLDAQALAGVTLADAQSQYDKDVNYATEQNHKSIADAKSAVAEFMASVQADNQYGDIYRYQKYITALKKAYAGAKLIIVGEGIDSSNIYIGNVS